MDFALIYLLLAFGLSLGGAGLILLTFRQLYRSRKEAEVTVPLTEAETAKKLIQLEKLQRQEEAEQAREEAALAKQKEAIRLAKMKAEEERLQQELLEKEQELQERQILKKELGPVAAPAPEPTSFLERLKRGVSKTRDNFIQGLGQVILGKKEIDEEVLEELEAMLIGADIGTETTYRILRVITEKVQRQELKDPNSLRGAIQQEILQIVSKTYPVPSPAEKKPLVLLFVGVNGVGKTTTIGKIAAQYRQQGKRVIVGAGDTFRAAAIEQLTEWAKRANCEVIAKGAGSDPSAVMFEAVQKAVQEDYDVVICDTAGRLHTKKNLMEELKKMVRVIKKVIPDAPHEVLLVLDATTGQNAIIQAREFREVADLTGLVITKLDGTAKGGVVIGIVHEFDIPVRYIGIGEGIEDLRPFEAQAFTQSLFT